MTNLVLHADCKFIEGKYMYGNRNKYDRPKIDQYNYLHTILNKTD